MSDADSSMKADQEFGTRVKSAVFWRSGTQIIAQIIAWASTLLVIRILNPADYGIFAMTQVILVFLNFLNGYGFASSLIQAEKVEMIRIRQAFGMLLLLNVALAGAQILIAPVAAAYYGQPMVADLLRWQALIYLATPFLVLPEALMSRNLEFKKPAIINLLSAVTGAATALWFAFNGYGVWTLVAAPIVIFWTRAICLVIATKLYIWPSFNFRGAGTMFGFGTTLLVSHLFWIIQSQSDIFIAGRLLSPHELGLYAEALFLTTIFASKFVPPLNEVAFPAYSRIQNDKRAVAWSFLKAVRLILLISCPLYLGLSVTAAPLVETLFGQKWLGMAPYVTILALAMPVMTLQILFAPVNNAMGKPQISARSSMFGAVLMPITYLIAIQYGAIGLAWGWLFAFPLLTTFTYYQSRNLIGINALDLGKAIWPGLSASITMAAIVFFVGTLLPDMAVYWRLLILVTVGAAAYALLLWVLARGTLKEMIRLVIKRKPPVVAPDIQAEPSD